MHVKPVEGTLVKSPPHSGPAMVARTFLGKGRRDHDQTIDLVLNLCRSDYMKSRISASKAARSFSELMNRVRYRNESFIVERGGKPICEILPARPPKFSGADLVDLLRTLPKPDEDYLAIVEELLERQPVVKEPRWQR